ncbi:AI-2E family transporter [Tropicimonas aquimaris]|uniref:AI-2E family transporter n=1 Tax=Tropicimonas aquimaris TaxID=914152 RepID=A0ABW3IS26_9RHOB
MDSTLRRSAGTLEFWRDLLLVMVLAIYGLVKGAAFLLPLTFAVLVFVLLVAVIDRIAAIRIGPVQVPIWIAHLAGVMVVLSGFLVIGLILSSQGEQVSEAIPRYAERFDGLASGIVSLIGDENAESLREALAEIDMGGWAVSALSSAQGFLAGLFLVVLYVPFMLAERGPMKRKFPIAAPDRKTGLEVRSVVQSISVGLQRYLIVKTFVSVLTGLFSYAIFKPMGLDFAETWAVLAFALNFIPSIGSILGVVLPALVALVQFDTITPFLVIAIGCGTIQFSIGNILEPSITGRSLNLSPFLVILSLTFWTTIWGVAGALLSVPIMVGMLIVFAHVPGLRWLAVLMSRDGQLAVNTRAEAVSEGMRSTQALPDEAMGE